MLDFNYSDLNLKEKEQLLFIKIAGFVIKIVLQPTEKIYYKRRIIEEINNIWGNGGFIKKRGRKSDFEIIFCSKENEFELLSKKKDKKHYYLTFERDFAKKKVFTFYSASFLQLQLIIKEIVSCLLANNGFIIHGSSCLDKMGKLHIFLAAAGGGKTTISNLLEGEGFTKFSDDSLIIRKVKDKWGFYSPPYIEKIYLPIKRETSDARLYFLEKAKKESKRKIAKKDKLVKLVLEQIWLVSEKVNKKLLKNVLEFVNENDFWRLNATLNAKRMKGVIYED